jgi:serine protease
VAERPGNGADDDCDGEVDEEAPCAPVAERCNGADDDCDGQVDEDLGALRCGVGACARSVQACQGGRAGRCEPGAARAELPRNEIDDDCDGQVDEGDACQGDEVLGNGLDDDCDGRVDEAPAGSITGRIVTCPEVEAQQPPQVDVPPRATVVPGRVLVMFGPGLTDAGTARANGAEVAARLATALPAPLTRSLRWERWINDRIGLLTFEPDPARKVRDSLELALALGDLPEVAHAVPETLAHAMAAPSDPSYRQQRWHYELMGLPEAWNIERGNREVVVAVVDTGIVSRHPDLRGNLLPGYDFVSFATAIDGDGWDADPEDDWSASANCREPGVSGCGFHGTHVAGTIAALADNDVFGTGVAPNVSHFAVRVLEQGGADGDILSGVMWAAGLPVDGAPPTPNPADVINMSIGGSCFPAECEPVECRRFCDGQTEMYEDVFDAVIRAGALVVVAAGNDTQPADDFIPARVGNALTVGAVRPDTGRSSYSNFGDAIDVMAPGGAGHFEGTDADRVWSTVGPGAGFGAMPGTSMAAPHIAGLAALLKSADPGLTPAQLRAVIEDTAGPAGQCAEGCGPGLANALAALQRVANVAAPVALQVTTQSLDFGYLGVDREVWFWNAGDAPIQWQATAIAEGAVEGQVTLDGAGVDGLARGALQPGEWGMVTVRVRRDGLLDGRFGAYVIVSREDWQEGGALPITFSVGEPCPDLVAVDVVAFEQRDGQSIEVSAAVARAPGFRYELLDVPSQTDLVVMAYVDRDNNNEANVGDYLGLWPTMDWPQVVNVAPLQRRHGIDISVAPWLPDGGAGAVGASCAQDAECDGVPDGICPEAFGADGYCTRVCSFDRWCPTGSACVGFDGGDAYCLATCGGDADCREAEAHQCVAYFQGVNLCVWPEAVAEPAPVGAACVADEACGAGGACISDWEGGYCTASCAGVDCPGDGVCQDFGEGQLFCLDGCLVDADCRPGYGCTPLNGGGVACLPIELEGCNGDVDCAAGEVCDGGQCVLAPGCQGDFDCPFGEVCGAFGVCESEGGGYVVAVTFGQVAATKANGDDWDAFGGEPDLIAAIYLGEEPVGQTAQAPDGLFAFWENTFLIEPLPGQSLSICVWDFDIQEHDFAGCITWADATGALEAISDDGGVFFQEFAADVDNRITAIEFTAVPAGR